MALVPGGKLDTILRAVALVNQQEQRIEESETAVEQLQTNQENQMDIVTAETEIGTFLGATLYRKILTFADGPNLDPLQIPHGIVGLDTVFSLRGMMKNPGPVGMGIDDFIPLPFVSDSGADDLALKITAGDVYIVTLGGGNWTGIGGFVEIIYTKSAS